MKILFCLFLFLVTPFCAAQSTIPDWENIEETTISEIKSNPWSFHDRWVVVSGVFNECVSLTCKICESDEPVDPYNDSAACAGVSFLDDNQEGFVRYSNVRILAKYDAGCSGIRDPKSTSRFDKIVVCTDRASEFENSIVVEMIKSREPSQGHVSFYGIESIIEIKGHKRSKIIEDFVSELPSWYDLKSDDIDWVFDARIEPEDNPTAAICDCFEDKKICDKIKPRLEGHIYNLPHHSEYKCYFAEQRNSKWLPVPE